jgi:hypothetical protein
MESANSLILCGSHVTQQLDTRYVLESVDSKTGKTQWTASHLTGKPRAFTHGEQVHHPVISKGKLIAEPAIYDLLSGRRIGLDGNEDDWSLTRPGHSCGTLSSAGSCIFFRAGNPTVMDLNPDIENNSRISKLAPTRPGCWINIIPASGLVLIPEASAGCICNYSLQTSMAFLPVKNKAMQSLLP